MMRIQGKKFTYVKQRRTLPNGIVTQIEMIEYPSAALIVPFLSADRIIFLKQFRVVLGKTLYELPAGTADRGESALACARRELPEETGYAAKKITRLGHIYPVPGYSTEVIHIFKAQQLFPRKADKDFDEIIQTVILTRAEIRKLFRQKKITDGKTICALAFCGII